MKIQGCRVGVEWAKFLRHIVIPTSLLKEDASTPLDVWGRRHVFFVHVKLFKREGDNMMPHDNQQTSFFCCPFVIGYLVST